ncbi:hypothetical protein Tco_0829969 [Tanacetum coccineum]
MDSLIPSYSTEGDTLGLGVWVEESHGIALIDKGMVVKSRKEGNGETTWYEHYGIGSSNWVALDVAGEESKGVELEKTLDVTQMKVGYLRKVLNFDVMRK